MDYKNPNYTLIYKARAEKLQKLRANPQLLAACHIHYKANPWDFVTDWGMTFDPRNIERNLPASIPFILYPKQVELMKWLDSQWRQSKPGLVEKTRDCGATWIAGAYAVAMWRYYDGFTAGFGSRKEELVDKSGDPKTIFEKIRFFIDNLPTEFRPQGYEYNKHSAYMRIVNPENGSTITGEAGDNIGRGGRQSIYFVDESAFIQRQDSKDAALSQNTNCQVDISTPNGNGNAFYRKRMGGKVDVFVMDWRDDPRKDQAWYDKQVSELDEIIVAQEIDRDYNASQENVFIPAKWVEACVDAHKKLRWEPVGAKRLSFDPADTGDAKALTYRHGNVILGCWELKTGDIRDAVPWARDHIQQIKGLDMFVYDADGMGAPIVKLALEDELRLKKVEVYPFRGGACVDNPDVKHERLDKTNADAFINRRAQAMYSLRERCEATYNAVTKGVYTDPVNMISFCKDSIGEKNIVNLKAELSRSMRQYTGDGRIKVESKKDMKARGVSSPNMSDSVMMSETIPEVKGKWDELPEYDTRYIV